MTWRFAEFELDEDRRELRLRGREVVLQPRVLDVLVHLVRNRDRVVPKDELLEEVWSDAIVTESSLQRAVSLARTALRAGGLPEAIRSYPRRGYRFRAETAPGAAGTPETESAPGLSPGLAAAREAFARAAWEEARTAFDAVDREDGLAGPDLERRGQCSLHLGRPADAILPLERAVAAHSVAGDRRAAARSAAMLCHVHFEGRRPAVAKGWHQRALRLLDGEPRGSELATLEWMAGRIALVEGDPEDAAAHCRRSLEIARSIGDSDSEALALVYLGHALVANGETRQGLACHDEAAAAVITGGLNPWCAGLVYCGIIYVCQNRGDWSRAAQWTESFTRWSDRCPVSTYPAVCRLHRAEVLTARGELASAEEKVAGTIAGLAESAPWAEGDANRLLGDVRLARGDLDGAGKAYRRARELGWDPSPGSAYLRLELGDAAGALRSLERSLEDPNWPCRQRRRFLLAAVAHVAAAAGDLQRARAAEAEVATAEDRDLSPAQRGALLRARAEIALAEGDAEGGIRTLRAAAGAWQELGCPLEVAPLRLRLAEALHGSGDAAEAAIELDAAEEIFRKAGAEGRLEDCARLRDGLGRA
jgi:DNA-binding winged helix-turn-helix (wHTH) protein/ATP/maltotriose-dependent transcriptional regulator MalT